MLTAIKKCATKNGFVQSRVYGDMFSNLGCDRDIDPSFIGHIVRGAKNPPRELIDKIHALDDYSQIVSCFDCVSSRIDINKTELFGKIIKKLAEGDSDINDETVVDLVNGTQKKDLPGDISNLSSFIAGIYIYVMKYTENKDKTKSVKEIDDTFIAVILSESDKPNNNTKMQKEYIDETDEIAARSFLIKHEEEKELIPLCQIAYFYNPHHQHVRSMYTEYSLLPYRVRKYILEQCEAEFLIEEEFHYSEGLHYFVEDLRAYELSSERYIYMFGQYFYRAFENYSDCKIDKYDVYSFENLYPSANFTWAKNLPASLSGYISDYLWMRENKIANDAKKPMDYLWTEKNFANCVEEDLTFWLCRFMIDACRSLFNRIKSTTFSYSIPEDEYAETQEDLYYCALLSLHNHYLCHQNQ